MTNEEMQQLEDGIKKAAESKRVRPLQETLNAETAVRNGITKVPTDPVERAGWARRKAFEMGWSDTIADRQPGEEG
jgi:hypothetical protein